MTKKFRIRYTADDELSRLISTMKHARKATGCSQAEFAALIGVSRETVVHIECLVECTVLSLKWNVLKKWYAVCASKISKGELNNLQTAINEYFFGSATSSDTSVTLLSTPMNGNSTDLIRNQTTQEHQYQQQPKETQ